MSNKSGVASQVLPCRKAVAPYRHRRRSPPTSSRERAVCRSRCARRDATVSAGAEPDLQVPRGNGAFGLGWNLEVPTMARKTSKGLPRYRDRARTRSTDTFILSHAEDLVRRSNETPLASHASAAYRGVRRDRARARTVGDSHQLLARARQGWRISVWHAGWRGVGYAHGRRPRGHCQPSEASEGLRWMLSEARDPFGNVIRYWYSPRPDDRRRASGDRRRGHGIRCISSASHMSTYGRPVLVWWSSSTTRPTVPMRSPLVDPVSSSVRGLGVGGSRCIPMPPLESAADLRADVRRRSSASSRTAKRRLPPQSRRRCRPCRGTKGCRRSICYTTFADVGQMFSRCRRRGRVARQVARRR